MIMMIKLQQAEAHADTLIDIADQEPELLLNTNLQYGATQWKSIHQKLLELYIEENKRVPMSKNLKTTSRLLAKLVQRESLCTLVVSLYPGNEGYSLTLRGRGGVDTESVRLPYEESELLEYVDAGQLAPVLVDLLDRSQANLFHSGCVIAELRDHRRATNSSYESEYVLLEPSPASLLCDVTALTQDGHRWTQDDKFALESELLLHTNPPLCLDPDPSVFYATSKIHYERNKLNAHILKKSVKKFSQAAVNRRRRMALCAAPTSLRLHDFVTRKKDKLRSVPPVNLKVGKPCVDQWRAASPQLSPPPSVDVDKYAKALERPKFTYDNTPVTVEEYTLETERSQGKVYLTRLTIQQRLTDDFYLGQLYVDRDLRQGHSSGSVNRFPLGTRANVEKYIKQFTEIFTEEGRRSVKIRHQVPGQPATVTYTHALPSYSPAQTSTAGAHPAANGEVKATLETLLSPPATLNASPALNHSPALTPSPAAVGSVALLNPTRRISTHLGHPSPGQSPATPTPYHAGPPSYTQATCIPSSTPPPLSLATPTPWRPSLLQGHLSASNGSAPPTPTTPTATGSSLECLLTDGGGLTLSSTSQTVAHAPPAMGAQVGSGVCAPPTSSPAGGMAVPLGQLGLSALPPGFTTLGSLPPGVTISGMPLSVLNTSAGQGLLVSSLSSSGGAVAHVTPVITSPPPASYVAMAPLTSTPPPPAAPAQGMVQLPISSLHQLMAANIKSGTTFRSGAPLNVLQLPAGQSAMHLVPQHRPHLTPTRPTVTGPQPATVMTAASGLATGPRAAGPQLQPGQQLVQLTAAQQQQLQAQLAMQQIQLQQLGPAGLAPQTASLVSQPLAQQPAKNRQRKRSQHK